MRFRKRPKIVDAVQVRNILSGDEWPMWLQRAAGSGKIHIQKSSVSIVIGQTIKTGMPDDWIALDTERNMVFYVSNRTMQADYEACNDTANHEREEN